MAVLHHPFANILACRGAADCYNSLVPVLTFSSQVIGDVPERNSSSARGQRLTAESFFDSRLPFGGCFGRMDRFDRRGMVGNQSALPAESGRGCRPAQDNRRYFEGMLWMARTGAQWRHLPDEYGKWTSVFRRYRRWVETGVFEAMLETLVELVERDRSADMIDSTVVRAHHCAVGIKRGLKRPRRLADRAAVSQPSSMPGAMRKADR